MQDDGVSGDIFKSWWRWNMLAVQVAARVKELCERWHEMHRRRL